MTTNTFIKFTPGSAVMTIGNKACIVVRVLAFMNYLVMGGGTVFVDGLKQCQSFAKQAQRKKRLE